MSQQQIADVTKYLAETTRSIVPIGYKQTEVGVIPEDWCVKRIGDLSDVIRGASPRPKGDKRYYGGAVPRLMVEDVTRDGKFVTPSVDSLTEAGAKLSRPCSAGTLTIVCSGTVGIPSILAVDACIHDGFLALTKVPKKISIDYLYHFFSTQRDKFNNSATHGGVFTNLTTEGVREFLVALPVSIEEQTAIANVLSDVDALICELEKLISKKQAIKTATMQQLLTGRIRLPQFALHEDGSKKGYKQSELGEIPEDWEVVKLGEIGQTVIGLTYSPKDVSEFGTLVLRSSNVQNGKLAYHDNVFVNMQLPERVMVQEGDILVCVRNGSRQLIGKCALIDKATVGAAFGAFMSIYRSDVNNFIFYQFQSNLIQEQINERMGATINQITNKDMAEFVVAMPKRKEEQSAIAIILSDMDKELQVLEQRLNKTRQIKQGMMQELLTGKTRLPFKVNDRQGRGL